MEKKRLSSRQIATLKHIAITCENGGMTTLTRDEREAIGPLWRRGVVEMWFRCVPDEGTKGSAFFKPSQSGWALVRAIFFPRSSGEGEAA